MSSRDHEERVLDAIENQFRTEEPKLIEYFSAFGSAAPLMKPVRGWGRIASSKRLTRRGRRWYRDWQGYLIAIELVTVFIAVIFVAALIAGASW
jgi:Protein of unknown function (DUF3040)